MINSHLDYLLKSDKKHEKKLGYAIANTIVNVRKLAGYEESTKKEQDIKLKIEKDTLLEFLTSEDLMKLLNTVCINPAQFKLNVLKHYAYKRPNGIKLFLKSFFILYKELKDNPQYKIDPSKLEDIIIRIVEGKPIIKKSDLIKDEVCRTRQSVTGSLLTMESLRNSDFTTGKRSYYGGKTNKKVVKRVKRTSKK